MDEVTPVPAPSRKLDDRGSVSLMAVICLGAFACLFFGIANLSIAYTEKVELQNAEDASVLSGATMIARGLNLVAMNNSTQAKLFALSVIHWGLERAIPIVRAYLTALQSIPYVGIVAVPFKIVLEIWSGVVNATKSIFNEGKLVWKIMKVLSSFSGAIVKAMPAFAALEAFRIARKNGATFGMMISPTILRGESGSSGLFLVEFPVNKGQFKDLCGPGTPRTPRAREMISKVRDRPAAFYYLWDVATDPFGAILEALGALPILGKLVVKPALKAAGLKSAVSGTTLDLFINLRLAQRCPSNTGEYAPWMLDVPLKKTQERLNYFGFVYRERKFRIAPALFKDMLWGDKRFAYGQARVYNADEFDSFNQDWRVKLVPANLFSSGINDAVTSPRASAVPGLKDLVNTLTTRLGEYVPTTH